MEQLFSHGVSTLVRHNGSSTTTIDIKTALSGKYVMLYFSAHWCPPCRGFTPRLADFYRKHASSKGFEIVFISSDKDDPSFRGYFEAMPWLAVPFAQSYVSRHFDVQGIPKLLLYGADGQLLCSTTRDKVVGDPEARGWPWSSDSPPPVAVPTPTPTPTEPSGQSGSTSDLVITLVGAVPTGQEYFKDYVGVWKHNPIPNNEHVFVHTKTGQAMYWQDDDLHWRTGSLGSADPTKDNFGCGSAYFHVSKGPSHKYDTPYEYRGLKFMFSDGIRKQGLGAVTQPRQVETKEGDCDDLVITEAGPFKQAYYKDYIGSWRHHPVPNNQHVFVHTTSKTALFWQDDDYHWRTGSVDCADPTKDNFGCGAAYLFVSKGPSHKYDTPYESGGLKFMFSEGIRKQSATWPPTPKFPFHSVESSREIGAGDCDDLVITQAGPFDEPYYKEYIGSWRHHPVPNNQHVFVHTTSKTA
eukprot:PhF_6_TR39657/c0_g3_i1/m.58848/K17609/NXN; nucleoredoxin